MAKKKDKPRVIYNIGEINLEIDYDKLAESIVKAQLRENSMLKKNEAKNVGFWKSIGLIIINKEHKTGNQAASALAFSIAWLFNMLAITGVVLYLIFTINFFTTFSWFDNIFQNLLTIAVFAFLTLLLFSVCFIFRAIANEIGQEKDRNYIISVFSGIVSFAALIVAFVTLFKGVG